MYSIDVYKRQIPASVVWSVLVIIIIWRPSHVIIIIVRVVVTRIVRSVIGFAVSIDIVFVVIPVVSVIWVVITTLVIIPIQVIIVPPTTSSVVNLLLMVLE